jgi:two-component system sensor histidine kinase HydH
VATWERISQLAHRHGLGETLTGHVLLVDDEYENLVVLRAFLEGRCTIVEARSATEALNELDRTRFDVVVTDHRMPGMTGVELLEHLSIRAPDTAGILITAFSDTPLLISAINRAAVFRHLKKPWEPDELLAAVAQARAHVRALRSNRRLLELLSQRTDALSAALAALEATQQQVLHMERLSTVGRLTAGITHDLRNVVQAMMLLEQQCAQDTVPAPLKERLHLGVAGMRNLLAGLQGINQFASGGSVALQIERIDPRAVLHDAVVVASMDPLAREHPLRGHRSTASLPPVRGDRQKLIQVLVNLLRNALQATHRGSAVLLEAYAAQGGVVIAVQDEGDGVAPEVLGRLFEPFVTSKGQQGVGMGLYMARLVAESHGGTLRLAARAGAGSGARFELWLPTPGLGAQAPTGP